MKVVKSDVIEASGSLQVCSGQSSGSEAVIHAMRNIFDADDPEYRAAALHNTRDLCPTIATYAINSYIQVTITIVYSWRLGTEILRRYDVRSR